MATLSQLAISAGTLAPGMEEAHQPPMLGVVQASVLCAMHRARATAAAAATSHLVVVQLPEVVAAGTHTAG